MEFKGTKGFVGIERTPNRNWIGVLRDEGKEGEDLLKTDDIEKSKKVVDNALCRIKKKSSHTM